MDIERDLLSVRRPTLVAEAVDIFAVRVGDEGIIFRGSGLFIILAISERIFDLNNGNKESAFNHPLMSRPSLILS